jgi:hypothetical protein
VSDSILLEFTGPDTVHLTEKKISKTRQVPVAIPESIDFDDGQLDEGVQVEENIDKVIPIDVSVHFQADETRIIYSFCNLRSH